MRSSLLFLMHFVSFVALENMHRRKEKKISAAHLFHCCSELLSLSGSLCCQVQKQIGRKQTWKSCFFSCRSLCCLCAVQRKLEKNNWCSTLTSSLQCILVDKKRYGDDKRKIMWFTFHSIAVHQRSTWSALHLVWENLRPTKKKSCSALVCPMKFIF